MRTTKHPQRVLVVDDEERIRELVVRALSDAEIAVDTAGSVPEAIAVDLTRYDLLITDIRMPGPSGNELLRYVKASFPALAVIVMTANPSNIEVAAESRRFFSVLPKPFRIAYLRQLVDELREAIRDS